MFLFAIMSEDDQMTWRPDLEDPDIAKLFSLHPSNRGTGLTTNLLSKIPEGVTYIVHTITLKSYIEDYCRKIGKEDIHIISTEQIESWLRARRTSVAIDHACFYEVVRDPDLCPVLDSQEEIFYNGTNGTIICQSRDKHGNWTLDEIA